MKKRWMAAAMTLALMSGPALAQMGRSPRPAEPDERAVKKEKAAKRQDDQAYKAALDRIPESKQKYDPWGSVVPAESAKKPK